jgi:hypothetical protein
MKGKKMLDHLLVLPSTMDRTVSFDRAPVSVGGSARTVSIDVFNPDHFGSPYLPTDGSELRWHGLTKRKSLKGITDIYPFHGGAIISPRVRKIIESVQTQGIEYIPLDLFHWKTKELVTEWRDIFDFSASTFTSEPFKDHWGGLRNLERRFGSQRIKKIETLVISKSADLSGIFLAKATNEVICMRVFVGFELAAAINEGLPRTMYYPFEPFLLKNRKEGIPLPDFSEFLD